mmetsp:Transcript_18008/g.38164  ORF Transcript_18008/g.38164 Transcript_18008/m.38164 type:complete len:249 (-) Transcript_18008:176-922(-)
MIYVRAQWDISLLFTTTTLNLRLFFAQGLSSARSSTPQGCLTSQSPSCRVTSQGPSPPPSALLSARSSTPSGPPSARSSTPSGPPSAHSSFRSSDVAMPSRPCFCSLLNPFSSLLHSFSSLLISPRASFCSLLKSFCSLLKSFRSSDDASPKKPGRPMLLLKRARNQVSKTVAMEASHVPTCHLESNPPNSCTRSVATAMLTCALLEEVDGRSTGWRQLTARIRVEHWSGTGEGKSIGPLDVLPACIG